MTGDRVRYRRPRRAGYGARRLSGWKPVAKPARQQPVTTRPHPTKEGVIDLCWPRIRQCLLKSTETECSKRE
jgi:hypothetical protein